ncbi:MAG: rod shape-determining protein MreC [Methylococcales bacterium]
MFAKGPSINTRFLVALLLSIILLVVDQSSVRLANVRAILSVVVYPILYVVNLPSEFFNEINGSISSYVDLKAEVGKLKDQQFVSDTKLLKFEALEKENIRLRSLLESSYNIGEELMVAEILSVNLSPIDHVVLVNKGSSFGLHIKQPVLDTQGVIGQVIRTMPLNSEIMLITDPNHAIPVQVNRNGLRTIAVGSGQLNRLVLPFLPNNADIKKGDLLITSGLGGTFPQGYPVAVVDDFQIQPHKQFAYISATPKAALDKIREVLIVWNDAKSVSLNSQSPPSPAQETTTGEAPVRAQPALAPANEQVLKPVESNNQIQVPDQVAPQTIGQQGADSMRKGVTKPIAVDKMRTQVVEEGE